MFMVQMLLDVMVLYMEWDEAQRSTAVEEEIMFDEKTMIVKTVEKQYSHWSQPTRVHKEKSPG